MCRVVQCSEIARSGNDPYIQRQIADKAIAEVKRVTGKDITNADFKALMWYYEKELWSKLGLSKDIEKLDYEQAAEKVSQEYRDARRGDQRELVPAGQRVSSETTGRAQSPVQPREDDSGSYELDGGESSRSRAAVGRLDAPRLVRDVSILITPATVRDDSPVTKRIQALAALGNRS